MDDYGSGYSSISNLRRYPFTKVKIDRSYVAALEDDPVAEVVIDSALALGKSLGITVVIEGVETDTQRSRLTEKAPDQMQGFLFGRPAAIARETSTSQAGRRDSEVPRPVLTHG
jgi:EAL domain-containing protein (putative c-di-GMP-specific phosphodiesterase class I)